MAKGAGWQPVPPPANPFKPFLMKPETVSALHDGLWMAVNGAGTAGARPHRRPRRLGQDRYGAGDLQPGQGARRRTEKDLRDHGWFVFFAPRDNPEAGRRGVRRALGAWLPGRADRQARHGNLFRPEGRPAAAGAAAATAGAAPRAGARRARGRRQHRGVSIADVRAAPLLPHRLAADCRRVSRCARSAWR